MWGVPPRRLTRRRLGALGAALAGTGALATTACGAASTPVAPQSGGGAKSLAPATIRFHSRGGAPTAQEPMLYAEQVPAFMEKYPTIKVISEDFTGENYYEKITVLGAGGTLGDSMWTSVGGGGIYNVAAQRLIAPIDPFVARERFNLNQYYKNCIEGLKREGKLYGLPFKSHPGVSIHFFNRSLLEAKGAGVPDTSWTLDRLVDAAKRVTAGDVYGYFPATSQKSVLAFTRSYGGELLTPDGKKSLLNSPEAVGAITWMYEAFNKHRIAPAPPLPTGGANTMFTNGKLASGRWGTSFQNTAQNQVKDAFDWFAALHPKGPGGKFGSDYEIDAYSVIASSKEQDAAWEWVKWITRQEAGIRLGEIGGTVGGRPDVYKSPRLLKDPIRKVFLEAMETAQPGRPVHNTRMAQYEKTIIDGLAPLWDGKERPTRTFLDELTRQVQTILDEPLP
jgi:ABC-type glycerol-3-phosphate transport system substrate-binding protein